MRVSELGQTGQIHMLFEDTKFIIPREFKRGKRP